MIDTPKIVQTDERLTAFIHLTIPRADARKVMGPTLQELTAAVAAQGVSVAGPWFCHHRKISPAAFDFEVSVPVSAKIAAAGRVQAGTWPAMKVARTLLHGTYEGLGTAWGELDAWVKANGHQPAEDLWEVYTKGPESSADPAAWRTELNRPVRG